MIHNSGSIKGVERNTCLLLLNLCHSSSHRHLVYFHSEIFCVSKTPIYSFFPHLKKLAGFYSIFNLKRSWKSSNIRAPLLILWLYFIPFYKHTIFGQFLICVHLDYLQTFTITKHIETNNFVQSFIIPMCVYLWDKFLKEQFLV